MTKKRRAKNVVRLQCAHSLFHEKKSRTTFLCPRLFVTQYELFELWDTTKCNVFVELAFGSVFDIVDSVLTSRMTVRACRYPAFHGWLGGYLGSVGLRVNLQNRLINQPANTMLSPCHWNRSHYFSCFSVEPIPPTQSDYYFRLNLKLIEAVFYWSLIKS